MHVLWPTELSGRAIDSRVRAMSERVGQPSVATILTVSGIGTIVVAIVLAAAVEPLLGLLVLVGLTDLALARLFASGKPGGRGAGTDPTAEPTYNPYARED
jgi:hypothetical protein